MTSVDRSTSTSPTPELPDELTSFAAFVRTMRMARSKADLGREVGCTGQMIGYIEDGKREPNVSTAIRLAIAFNTNPWQMLSHFGLVDRDALLQLAGQEAPDDMPEARGARNG